MAYSIWSKTVTDDAGNAIAGAAVAVFRESDGAAATVYGDPAGSSPTLSTDSQGFVSFYAPGLPAGYKVEVTSGGDTQTWRHQLIGEAQGHDVDEDQGNSLMTRDYGDARYRPYALDNLTATTAPTANDDSDDGYSAGSVWFDTSASPPESYKCIDATVGSAVWVQTTLTIDELGTVATKDYGTASAEIQDNAQNRDEYLGKSISVTEIAGTTYTLQASDEGKIVYTTNSSTVTITLPDSLPSEFQCGIKMGGTGSVLLVTETDSLNAPDAVTTLSTRYTEAFAWKSDATTWEVQGGMMPIISQSGLSVYDTFQWDGSQLVKATDVARVGTIDYADDATQTTAYSYTTGSVDNLPNDGAGSGSTSANAPNGVTDVYDTVNDRFDFSGLKVGDKLTVRVDLEITTTVANQDATVSILLGVGGTSYTLPIVERSWKTSGAHRLVGEITFDIGDSNTATNYGNIQFESDDNASVVVNGWRCFITLRG